MQLATCAYFYYTSCKVQNLTEENFEYDYKASISLKLSLSIFS